MPVFNIYGVNVDRSLRVRKYAEKLRLKYPKLSWRDAVLVADKKVKYC